MSFRKILRPLRKTASTLRSGTVRPELPIYIKPSITLRRANSLSTTTATSISSKADEVDTASTASSYSYSFRKRRRPSTSSSDGGGTTSPASSTRGQKENLRRGAAGVMIAGGAVSARTRTGQASGGGVGTVEGSGGNGSVGRVLRSSRLTDNHPLTQVNQICGHVSEEDEMVTSDEEERPGKVTLTPQQESTPFPPAKRSRRCRDLDNSLEEVSVNLPKLSCTGARKRQQPQTSQHPRSSNNGVRASSELNATLFTPRKMAMGKAQEAKLKRLTSRKIEVDPEVLLDMSSQSVYSTPSQNSSLLNISIADPKERLLDLCVQSDIKEWSDLFDENQLSEIVKLGEGVYGEVFQCSSKSNVIKIFPLEGDQIVNGEKQMSFDEVFPEVYISRKMTELGYKHRNDRTCNYVQLRKSTIVQGLLPYQFLEAWKTYASEKGTDNENLDFLPDDQLWMVLEFDFAGEPLEKFRFMTCREARSVILQLAISLATAESAYQFEHRDLHWLNVLVKRTTNSKLRYRVGGISYSVMTQGVQVSIIDFTVSRLTNEGNQVYVDMSDSPEIFEGEGDYQFEIYRMMRDNNKNNWRTFHPKTNLYWLHYLMEKLLTETSYPRRDPDSVPVESELRALYDCVLSEAYKSAQDLVHNNFYFDTCRIDTIASSDND